MLAPFKESCCYHPPVGYAGSQLCRTAPLSHTHTHEKAHTHTRTQTRTPRTAPSDAKSGQTLNASEMLPACGSQGGRSEDVGGGKGGGITDLRPERSWRPCCSDVNDMDKRASAKARDKCKRKAGRARSWLSRCKLRTPMYGEPVLESNVATS